MLINPQQIIWSADVDVYDLERVITKQALPKGTVIKLDRLFFENNDKSLIEFCQEHGYPVFVDAKIIEIPDKVVAIAETYLKHKPWMLNVMAGACSTGLSESEDPKRVDALARFAKACSDAGTRSCAVTVLTSKTESTSMQEFGVSSLEQVSCYAKMMKLCRMTDIVCSPLEAYELRRTHEFEGLDINTPGVRLPDSSVDDQARIMTPARALSNGADRLVIGRDLTNGDGDIVERVKRNYARIMENIEDEEV